MFSERIDRIAPSATLEMTAKAAELRLKGINVINLSVGEPDFNTPSNIQEAAIKAIKDGQTKYTPGPGLKELRMAACTKLKRDNDLNFNENQIIVSCGGKHSLYNACQVLFQKGDEVIIFEPYWVSFPDFVAVTGAKPVFVKTNASKQYEPDFDDLKQKINKNTKGIIINSPSNPTGGVWSQQAIMHTLEIAEHNNCWIFSDECYEQLTYDIKFKSIGTLSENPKILTFQSCSKTYAMTGWRIGYMAGDSKVVKAMSKLQGQSTSCPNSIAQHAAIEALQGSQEAVQSMKTVFQRRRDVILKRLNNMNQVVCDTPKGAFYVFPNFKHYMGKSINGNIINSGNDISMFLLSEKAVVSVSGNSFGASNNIRFSYALSSENINQAMDHLEYCLGMIN